jgi:outer membrane receptor protein involved in Fe transport
MTDAGLVQLQDRLFRVRTEVEHRASARALVRFGTDTQVDDYAIGVSDPADVDDRLHDRTDLVGGAFGDVVLSPEDWFTVTPGLRIDVYSSGGDAAVAVEPRLAARFEVTDRVALVHAVGVAHQAPGFLVPMPGHPATGLKGRLQRAVQSSAGVEFDLFGEAHGSIGLFQTAFFHLTDPFAVSRDSQDSSSTVSPAGVVDETPPPDPTERRRGRAAGVEVMLRRRVLKRVGGLVSYTLSRADQSSGRSGPRRNTGIVPLYPACAGYASARLAHGETLGRRHQR